MTYCVAMCLADGLVFASDSRTNAGVDHIATFKKLHVFAEDGERVLVLQSAGNLATTQSVISLLSTRIATQQEPNLLQVSSLYDAAMLIGKTLQEVIQRDSSNQQHCGNTNFNCNLLLGGQIAGETHRLFHIYPEGNFIEAARYPVLPDWREQIWQTDHRSGVKPGDTAGTGDVLRAYLD